MSYPLGGFEFRFPSFKGFANDPGDWLTFGQTTLIVGRNNVGKSAVIDALKFSVDEQSKFNPAWNRNSGDRARFEIRQTLHEPELKHLFPDQTRGGPITGSHWDYGSRFVGTRVTRHFDASRTLQWLYGPDFSGLGNSADAFLNNLVKNTPMPRSTVFGVAAERNVEPEPQSAPNPVETNGQGLTNLVRAFLYDSELDMNEIEVGLLNDLNFIYQSDANFLRILCQQDKGGRWEIFLESDESGVVRLSQSGSSLKSIFIILATLRLNPLVSRDRRLPSTVFFVEEPENNLHPALLRRLLSFMHKQAAEDGFHLIITTHSSAAIDWSSRESGASLFHVLRADEGVIISTVQEYGNTRRLIEDLDIRASEILQSNGIIWVEGPSDRIYINRWISLISSGQLIEGQHYSVMFYGGKLLSHLSCANPDGDTQFIELLRMNRNSALVMDSDRRKLKSGRFRSHINSTKRRIRDEARKSNAFIWVTEGREIENYLATRLVRSISGSPKTPGQYESVPSMIGISDKIELARRATEAMTADDLDILDLKSRLESLRVQILQWNCLTETSP